MTKFKCINGWTKEKMKAQIRKYNNGTRAINSFNGRCTYLSHDNNRCAIGCFIPTEHIKAAAHYEDVGDLLRGMARHENIDLSLNMPLELLGLQEMQKAHDRSGDSGPGADNKTTYEPLGRFIDECCED